MTRNTSNKQYFKDYASPMIIRSVFSSLMYTADRLIAALFIGASALVATTLISPLMFLIAAISSFFISGLGAYVGLLIGRGNIEKANRTSSAILILMAIIGSILALPSIFFTEQIAIFLGARNDLLLMSIDYLRFFSLSFPLLLLGKGLDVLILNDGSPKYSFILNIVTTVSNLILNIIAVAILGMGIKGLAIATVISSGVELTGALIYFIKKSKIIKFTRPSFHLLTFIRIAYNGLSDFTMMIVEAVMVYVINIAFINYLTPKHFEAYAAVSIILFIFYGIYMGATMGLQPILSQMMGRGEFGALKSLLYYSVKKTIVYGAIVYVALIPLMGHILSLFIKDAYTLKLAIFFYITLGAATLLSSYPLQASIFFTAINRPLESALISLVRTFLIIPPLVYILISQIGASGIALGFAIADIVLIVGIIIYMKKTDISKLKVYE